MAIKLIANYSKRLGLPGFSSHQFSVSVETELVTTDDIVAESTRLYRMLQENVDGQIQATGFVPAADYGMEHANGHSSPATPGNAPWKCSAKQRDFIINLVEERQLPKNEVEQLAVERFGKGVRLLNKIEASGLIDELIDRFDGNRPVPPRRRDSAYAGAGRGRTR